MMAVFPNYAARRENGWTLLEASHPLLCDALVDAGLSFGVAAVVDTANQPGTYRALLNPRVRFMSLGNVGSRSSKAGKVLEYLALLPRIGKTVYESRFCYVFTPGHVGLIAWLFCVALGRPYALYLRGEWSITTPRILQWAHVLLFRNARFVLCTGSGLKEKIAAINPRCEAVVPMSEVLSKCLPPAREWRPGAARCRILFVGQVARDKGIFELIDALEAVRGKGFSNWDLEIVGAGADAPEARARVEQLGLAGQVRFLGLIVDSERLATLYGEHDVFCLPSHHEGFPRVIYEAMLFGLPIVTTRVGQIDAVVRENENGLFAAVRDSADLADKIIVLLEDAKFRQRLGRQAYETVEPLVTEWRKSTHGHQVARWMERTGSFL